MSDPLQPGDIEKPTVQPCEPLETVKSQYWNSRRCVTVTCPEGTFGEPIEVCVDAGTFSSQTSQDEANALADALARQMAVAALHCSPEPVLEDEANLNVTMLGEYDISALIDRANLAASMVGDYEVSAFPELASLAASLLGEAILYNFPHFAPLHAGLSPLSEYRISGFIETTPLTLRLLGSHFPVTIIINIQNDYPSLAMRLGTSSYLLTIVSTTGTDSGNLSAALRSGNYTQIVVQQTMSDTGNAATRLQSGSHIQTSVPLSARIELGNLSSSLHGTHAIP